MMRRIRKFLRKGILSGYEDIAPDEIFLDSSNLPDFNTQQFEGVIEKPISKRTVLFLGIFFIVIAGLYLWRLGHIEITQGQEFAARSENNRLRQSIIFANRGVIYDRSGTELAWNEPGVLKEGEASTTVPLPLRSYTDETGFAHLIGYVKPPMVDVNGYYYQKEFTGIAGIERMFNDKLSGENGLKLSETDALGNLVVESQQRSPVDGEDMTLSIDARIQTKLYNYIKATALDRGFQGGAGVIMDVTNGEIIALASYPEYSLSVMAQGNNQKQIAAYNADPQKPFLDRAIGGLYAPGSIVKPFVGIGALNEGVITADKKILSTGSISVPNPYYPDKPSVFHDWRPQGWVNIKDAIAVSSDVYFYEVGGGFEDQQGIGIANIKKYAEMFGIGKETGIDLPGETDGVIPDPEWKKKAFNGEPWYLGDTYHTAIGQYGFQVTPIQMVRATAAMANGGTLLKPELIKGRKDAQGHINISQQYFNTIQEGMELATITGTAKGLNVPYVKIGAKTGTAEVGIQKTADNSWVIGFWPFKEPKYAFTVVMEKGPTDNEIGGLFVMRSLLDWMNVNTPEYITGQSATSTPR